MARDYKKEYANYHSRPEQIKRRAARNAARRAMRGRKELTDEKDVHHKDNNPMNNDKSNLSIVTQHYNRREPRLRVEDLRKWFGKGKKGDWVRVGTDGEIKGDCAREPGEGKPKCMPRSKAHSMDKKDRASSARRKRRADPSVDRPGTGNKPIMVKTDKKKNESMNENVNMKNVDKLKTAARDFGKNKDINSKSIEDALMTIVQSMRVLDKSTSGRADVKHEKIIDKQIVRINNIINKTNYGKTGQSEEGKEIVKILNKHKLNGPRGFHKVVYEGVEMNEQFVVKYAKNKRGPIYQTKFSTQGEAEKFLAQKRKEGMNGIVSKAGKPVSMQKMKDMQKESIDENKIFFVKVGDGRDSMTVKTKARNSREALKKMRSEHPKSRVSLDINQKQGQPAGALESVDLEENKYPMASKWMQGAKSVKGKGFEFVRSRDGVHTIKKNGKTVGDFSLEDDSDLWVINLNGVRGQVTADAIDDIPKLISNKIKESIEVKDFFGLREAKASAQFTDHTPDKNFNNLAKKHKVKVTHDKKGEKTTIHGDENAVLSVLKTMYGNDWKDMYTKKGSVYVDESVDLEEKNVPTNPALWSKIKSQAKAKFDVYPSAYANGWAAKQYKAAGGGWKTTKESTEMKSFWDIREGSCGTMNAQTKKDEKPPFVPNRKVGVKKDKYGNVVKDKNRAKHLAKLAMRGEDK